MKSISIIAASLIAALPLCAAEKPPEPVEFITTLAQQRRVAPFDGIILKGDDRLSTPTQFKPSIEITSVAKTDSTDIRCAYAADQVILRWKDDHGQLRVDGGPANGHHKHAAGNIPVNKYVTIRWIVLPSQRSFCVDGHLRFEHAGNYSAINNPVSVFPAVGSRLTVKSLKVRQFSPTPR